MLRGTTSSRIIGSCRSWAFTLVFVTVAPFLAAQPDPVLAEKPRGEPLQLGSGQAMRLALDPTLTETARPAPTSLSISQDPTCLRPGSLGCPSSTVTAQLTTADCPLDDGSYYDVFRFSGTEGQTVAILMSSDAFDTFLFLQNPAGDVVASDDDSGGGTNSHLVFTLPTTGAWTVLANSFSASAFGPYILSLNCAGGIGPTATPLGAPPPTDIPTLSFPALLLLVALLTTTGLFFLRRG
jgi:hypothetical protein